jgi:hypothetical protein
MHDHHLNYIHKIEKKPFFQSIYIFVYFKISIKNQITNLLQMENEFK